MKKRRRLPVQEFNICRKCLNPLPRDVDETECEYCYRIFRETHDVTNKRRRIGPDGEMEKDNL